MDDLYANEENLSEEEFLKLPPKAPKKQFKVKCLGWCDKEFLSESKFLRFCEKCRDKRNKLVHDCYLNSHNTNGLTIQED